MKCPYCGAENAEDDNFCGECGRAIEKRKEKNIRFPAWGIVIAAFVAILVGGSIGFVFGGYFGNDQVNQEDRLFDPQLNSQTDEDNMKQMNETDDSSENKEVIRNDMPIEDSLESETDMYILPQSNKEYLTNEDVEGLSLKEINYAKNEIYARHGRKFQSEELQRYFNSKPWYEGLFEAEDFDDNYSSRMLNDYEKANAEFLRKKEYSISSEGYELDH